MILPRRASGAVAVKVEVVRIKVVVIGTLFGLDCTLRASRSSPGRLLQLGFLAAWTAVVAVLVAVARRSLLRWE